MLGRGDIARIAQARLDDADALVSAERFDGAIYLCGYTVEMALKARICRTLRWSGYPETRNEFRDYQSFRTHNLDVLLRLSGAEEQVKGGYFAQWSVVVQWDPEARYKPIGSASVEDARSMIESSRTLLGALWNGKTES